MPKLRSNRSYIAIDPGQSGGMACVRFDGQIITAPARDTELEYWQDILALIFNCGTKDNCVGVIEKVHSMPAQGVASSFKFGLNYGLGRMALVASGLSWEEVTPQAWQKALAITPRKKEEKQGDFKVRLLRKCHQLYPSYPLWSVPNSKGKQLAVCDALLIATYLKRKFESGVHR